MSDSGGVPSNAPDKQVTNGVVGSLSPRCESLSRRPKLPILTWGGRSLKDYLSLRIGFPDLFAGLKGNGRVPKADEEIAGVSHLLHGFLSHLQAFASNVLILFRIYAYCSHAGPCVAGVSQWAS